MIKIHGCHGSRFKDHFLLFLTVCQSVRGKRNAECASEVALHIHHGFLTYATNMDYSHVVQI
jgi:hypothetical protein